MDCVSTIHEDGPVPAVVSGIFDGSDLNGKPPSRVHYCERCANFLHEVGFFEPDLQDRPNP
jgi:hypothetical protein